MEHRLLTHRQAADFLGIKEGTLHVWRNVFFEKHPIPYIKIGKLVKYRMSDLEDYINNRTQLEHKKESTS